MTPKGKRIALLAGCVVLTVLAVAVWFSRDEILFRFNVWQQFDPLGKNEQGRPEYRHRQTGIVFVELPGGTFRMGSPESEEGRHESEGPVHEVQLSPFLIAKYELSQAEWRRVMGDSPAFFKGENLPVERLSWEDGQRFCKMAGLLLPTEAQWEYACRAVSEGPYAGTGVLGDMGWNARNSGGQTHPVGQKMPNAFGLYDMHGNVWEWCEDIYEESFYAKSNAVKPNPVCVTGSGARVSRGGSWNGDAGVCRSADRCGDLSSLLGYCFGMRPVWSPVR